MFAAYLPLYYVSCLSTLCPFPFTAPILVGVVQQRNSNDRDQLCSELRFGEFVGQVVFGGHFVKLDVVLVDLLAQQLHVQCQRAVFREAAAVVRQWVEYTASVDMHVDCGLRPCEFFHQIRQVDGVS